MSPRKRNGDEMRSEYDFSKGVRGKYAERVAGVGRSAKLAPDVALYFREDELVNDVLRAVVKLARMAPRRTRK